ncbi:MAG: transglycosylase domain-containing protein [Clostridia bacterium]|nr:transglycosylase domain-containing protein [Clostridia bacterium]
MKTVKKIVSYSVRAFVIILFSIFIIGALVCFFINARMDYEGDEELFDAAKSTSVTHFYANSAISGAYAPIEMEVTAFGAEKKVWYSADEVSDYLKKGFVAVEDREFYTHPGVNFRRTAGALYNYIFKKGERYGASTITQQVVKNISGDNEISASRKLYEIFRALRIEKNHTKDEILELYMNVVPMSENIAGVGFAADRYFGKEPSELTLAEAATIVGITNSPVRYDPRVNSAQCIERRNTVLRAMLDMEYITNEEFSSAKGEPLVLTERESGDGYSSWFLETVMSELTADIAKKYDLSEAAARLKLIRGGYNIYTTENPYVQSALEEIFEDADALPKEVGNGLDFAMCVCDSKSGCLLGIIGSCGEKRGNRLYNQAEAPHPPGSALKPLALYAPLLNEKKINWASVFDDVPVEFNKKGEEYVPFPRNSPAVYDGIITLKDALRQSKNTVAVRLFGMLGARKIFDSLKNDFGFDTLAERAEGYSGGTVSDLGVSPLALGQLSFGVSLRKLTEAYTVFPSEGTYTEGRSYLLVTDKNGAEVIKNPAVSKRVFAPSCARIMNQLLMNVVTDGTARAVSLKDRVDTAGKTGTTSASRDKLFVGYTPYFTAGIWCGYPTKNESVAGITPSHLEIWDSVMTRVHDLVDCEEHFSLSGLVERSYCKDSGAVPDAVCSLDLRGDRIAKGYFTPDNAPSEPCTRHVLCKYDTESESLAPEDAVGENIISISLVTAPERKFPVDVPVGDEKYIYRPEKEDEEDEE